MWRQQVTVDVPVISNTVFWGKLYGILLCLFCWFYSNFHEIVPNIPHNLPLLASVSSISMSTEILSEMLTALQSIPKHTHRNLLWVSFLN